MASFNTHHWLTYWLLGLSGIGTNHSNMPSNNWSMQYALHLYWYYQICMVSLLLKLMHWTTVLVGFCNWTRTKDINLLFTKARSSKVHCAIMQPMNKSWWTLWLFLRSSDLISVANAYILSLIIALWPTCKLSPTYFHGIWDGWSICLNTSLSLCTPLALKLQILMHSAIYILWL